MKKLVCLALTLIMLATLLSATIGPSTTAYIGYSEENGFLYSTFGNSTIVYGYTGGSTNVVVPKTIGRYDVLGIHLTDLALTSLDISFCTALESLFINKNQLTQIDVSNNTKLRVLDVSQNQLTEIDVSNNPELHHLHVEQNQLTEIDVRNNTLLRNLRLDQNQLTEIDVSKNPKLCNVVISQNQLTEIDVSNNPELYSFYVEQNQLTEIDVRNNTMLVQLGVNDNQLTELDISKNTMLMVLHCENNQLTQLDISNMSLYHAEFIKIYSAGNRLTTLIPPLAKHTVHLVCFDNDMGQNPDMSIPGWGDLWDTAKHKDDLFREAGLYYYPQRDPGTPLTPNTLLPGITFSFKSGEKPTNPADFTALPGANINLTTKTLTIPSGYNIEAYSTDGGRTWTAGNLTQAAFEGLLSNPLELWLCFKDFNPNSGKPQGSGDEHNIIAFDFIPLTLTGSNPRAVLNLSAETITLPENFSVAAYSTDGGKKWKRGDLPAENRFPRLLNKGMTLHVTDNFDRSSKKPAADAETITFPKIDARPKRNADKLKPFYGETNWVLAKKGSTAAVFAGLEYAPSANGKTPDGNWLPMPQDGLPVLNSRATVLVRTAPTAARAASTAWRVRPAVFGKAPNYKVKNDEITVKAGTYVSLPDGTVTLHREKKKIPVVSGMEVWNAATGRRPASLRQVV